MLLKTEKTIYHTLSIEQLINDEWVASTPHIQDACYVYMREYETGILTSNRSGTFIVITITLMDSRKHWSNLHKKKTTK